MIPLSDQNPTRVIPMVSFTLIGLCVLTFFWQLSLSELEGRRATVALGVIPAVILHGATLPEELSLVSPYATIFTSMFLHGGWMHLISNMLYLWIFADNVEESMGWMRFLVFYFVCGVAAVFAQALPDPKSVIPMIGASGAISGVLGAYVMLFPRARVIILVPFGFMAQLLQVPAAWVLGLWFLLQLVQSVFASSNEGGVAFGAHVGGFVAGIALVTLFKKSNVRLFR